MNPHCVCPAGGFCPRHKINKSDRDRDLCAGIANAKNCILYWLAWENGQLGATKPDNPIFNPEGFPERTPARGIGDGVSRTISAVTLGTLKPCGGCKGRESLLNHWFPGNMPPVEAVELTEPVKRNFAMHVWPVKKTGVWQWNVKQVLKRAHLFNGRRIVSIVTSGDADDPEVVKKAFGDFTDEFIVLKNKPNLAEYVSFVPMLERLESTDLNEVTFYCHAKGVRYKIGVDDVSPVPAFRWASAMYETCLDHWDYVRELLKTKAMAGSFKGYGATQTHNKHGWHYSGTFYWFRNADVYQRNWRYADKKYYGTEAWPGHLFKPEETACIFFDDTRTLYSEEYWDDQVQPQLEQWRAARSRVQIAPTVTTRPSAPPSTIGIATACWGDYWDRFGRDFLHSLEQANPRPADVVIVTDKDIEVPSWVRHVRPKSSTPMWDWFNESVAACRAEWLICPGIDDLFLNHAFALQPEGDVMAIAAIESGELWIADESQWPNILEIPGNPMKGGAVFRRDVFLRFPWRRVTWSDWMQWLEFRQAGVDVRFDTKPRFLHRKYAGAHSAYAKPEGMREIQKWKAEHRKITSPILRENARPVEVPSSIHQS